MQRHSLNLGQFLIPSLDNHVVQNGLSLRQVALGQISIRDTDLYRQNARTVAKLDVEDD